MARNCRYSVIADLVEVWGGREQITAPTNPDPTYPWARVLVPISPDRTWARGMRMVTASSTISTPTRTTGRAATSTVTDVEGAFDRQKYNPAES